MKASKTFNPSDITFFEVEYLKEKQRSRIYQLLLNLFVRKSKENGLLKNEMAKILNSHPSQITRWLKGPANLELDTISALFTALGAELEFEVKEFSAATIQSDASAIPAQPEVSAPPESESTVFGRLIIESVTNQNITTLHITSLNDLADRISRADREFAPPVLKTSNLISVSTSAVH